MSFYTDSQRAMQARFDAGPLADRLEQTIVTDHVPGVHQPFIESRDFFFLATVNASGQPTVSYKGGGPGIVTVVDPTTIAFPLYDGNGMFLSAGNVAETASIGLLFVDFETPNRLRVQATATVSDDDPLASRYPGAQLIVRGRVDQVFVNCGRYIHRHTRVASSPHVPDAEGQQPLAAWKRIDMMQDVLPPQARERVDSEGGPITMADYGAKLADGEA